MVRRRLSPEERAAWGRLARSVRPLLPPVGGESTEEEPPTREALGRALKSETSLRTTRVAPPLPPVVRAPVDTLDGSWERRIRRGLVSPDRTIDLHGYTLAQAHGALDQALAGAVAAGQRVLLVITGKPRDGMGTPGATRRGAIRAEIGDWLRLGAHADRIASVRSAHPVHGGNGALYVILRRGR